MSKFTVRLPAVVRQALHDSRAWFAQVRVPRTDLDLLKVETCPAPHHKGCDHVGLTFERGLRFHVVYGRVTGVRTFYNPVFVQLWRREQQGCKGHSPVWTKWQWEPGYAELRKVA